MEQCLPFALGALDPLGAKDQVSSQQEECHGSTTAANACKHLPAAGFCACTKNQMAAMNIPATSYVIGGFVGGLQQTLLLQHLYV